MQDHTPIDPSAHIPPNPIDPIDPPINETALHRAADAIRACLSERGTIAIVTGAGCSAESGIPTFRGFFSAAGNEAAARLDDDPDAVELPLWANNDPIALATPQGFARDPELVTRWYDWRRRRCLKAQPNAGHLALAELERLAHAAGSDYQLFTQNIDRLHQRAGSHTVHELHGSLYRWRDLHTHNEHELLSPEPLGTYPPPAPDTGNPMRPCVVWFGEALPASVVRAAERAVQRCTVFMSIGTSAVVYPAAGFAEAAAARGALVIEVNLEPTPLSPHVDINLRGRSAAILPRIVAALDNA